MGHGATCGGATCGGATCGGATCGGASGLRRGERGFVVSHPFHKGREMDGARGHLRWGHLRWGHLRWG